MSRRGPTSWTRWCALPVLLAAVMAFLVSPPALAQHQPSTRVFVSPDGEVDAPGTIDRPLSTLGEAVERVADGGSVLVRGGVYHERVVISRRRGITITAYRGERAILDGGPLVAPRGRSAMVAITDSSAVTVSGLEIRGYDTTTTSAMPIGIYVHGASDGIRVLHNRVHSMGTYNQTLGSFDLNAHGIAVYGDRADHPISDVTIQGNEVDHLSLGASESVVVNGNVTRWRISGNWVHDNNNIGIDAIGFEPTLRGKKRFSPLNRARHGVISDNTVERIRSRGNPSYFEDGSWCNCADGIYVDGGTQITVERNEVRDNDIGIEVAAENARGSADHVTVRDNVVSRSLYTGVATGGYCDGAKECGGVRTGRAFANRFVHNTLWDNNRLADGSPEVLVQYRTRRTTIADNIIVAAGPEPTLLGTASRVRHDGESTPPRLFGNLYWAAGGDRREAAFGVFGRTYQGWRAFTAAPHGERRGRFLAPRLRHPAAGDFHLRRRSPAVDAAVPLAHGLAGHLDIDRQPRRTGPSSDTGADERSAPDPKES